MHARVSEQQEIGFQITPIVDIVSLLIMFFMCSASTSRPEAQIGVNTPGTSGTSPIAELHIGIQPDGSVTFNESPIGAPSDQRLPDLRARLQRATHKFGASIPVFVQPSPAALHQRVIDVLDACSASGVKNLSFSDVRG